MRVFVSYSRRDFHAAEQLTGILAQYGLDPWLDVERLAAGTDWSRSIDEAIDEADAFVLLASPAAVGSREVTREWGRARDRGLTVYVAPVRNVEVPAELADQPTVDLRHRFEDGALALCDALLAPEPALPTPYPGRVPWPPPVVLVASVLVFDLLAVAILLEQGAAELLGADRDLSVGGGSWTAAFGIALTCVVFVGYVGALLRGFVTRDVSYRTLWAALIGALPFYVLLGALVSRLVDALLHGQLDVLGFQAGANYFVHYRERTTLAMLAASAVGLACLVRSAAVFRWLPTGEAPAGLRRRVLGERAVPPSGSVAAGAGARRFAVIAADADAPIAAEVRRAFRAERLREAAAEPDSEPDVSVIVVSNMTDWSTVAGRLGSEPAVAVLAASVRLPDEAGDLRRFQWLDHRDGRTGRLAELARSLREPGSAPRGGPPGVPRGIDRFTAPLPVRATVSVLVALFAVFFGGGVLSVTVARGTARDRHEVSPVLLTIPDPNATAPGGRHKTFEEDACERLGWPATPPPGLLDCAVVRQLPTHDALPWERPRMMNPKYVNRYPGYANTVLRVRAGLAATIGLLLLATAWLLGRRGIRAVPLVAVTLITFALTAAWIVLAAVGQETSPGLMALYVAGWLSASTVAGTRGARLGGWLPAARPPARSRATVSPPLLRASLPVLLLIMTMLYARGTVL